jgi:hypothetical protein
MTTIDSSTWTLRYWERCILGIAGPYTYDEYLHWTDFHPTIEHNIDPHREEFFYEPWNNIYQQVLIEVVEHYILNHQIAPAPPIPEPEADPNDLDFGLQNNYYYNPHRNSFRQCRHRTKPYPDVKRQRK